MKKKIPKIIILTAIFIVTIIAVSILLNKENGDSTVEMEKARLPLLYAKYGDEEINCMHGYTGEIDAASFRETIIPLDESVEITFVADEMFSDYESISYEIRSIDTTRLVEKDEVTDITNEAGKKCLKIKLKDLLENNTEYLLGINIKTEEDNVWYYTRIIKDVDSIAKQALDFAKDLNEKIFDKSDEEELVKYFEPSADAKSVSYDHVDINSKLDMVTWGNLEPKVEGNIDFSVVEVHDSIASIEAKYRVNVSDGSNNRQYYVNEFYRIRLFDDELYLLDYDRNMTQIIDAKNNTIIDNNLVLGIRDSEIKYMTNESETVLAFVQAGELFCYDMYNDLIVKVFSFADNSYDSRNNYNQHDIDIIKVDESGNIDFMIYGYMNRGKYEGKTGILVYHYDNTAHSIEEEVFIESQIPYQMIKEELGKLLYINNDGKLIIMLNNVVYGIDLIEKTYDVIIDGLGEDCYKVSEDGSIMAWQTENSVYDSKEINVLDFESYEKYSVNVSDDQRIYPIGFMNKDFIYGVADSSEIVSTPSGGTVFPMEKLVILNEGNEIKTYSQNGIYILDAYVEDDRIVVKRGTKGDLPGIFEPANDDSIVNNDNVTPDNVTLMSRTDSLFKTEYYFSIKGEEKSSTPRIIATKEVLFEGDRVIKGGLFDISDSQYFVYVGSELKKITGSAKEAVKTAYNEFGVVVQNGEYIYIKGDRASQIELMGYNLVNEEGASSIETCINMILTKEGKRSNVKELLNEGYSAVDIIKDSLKCKVFDLTGCPLDAMFNYISKGCPVIAIDSTNEAMLITQFDIYNITVVSPAKNKTYKISLDDSRKMFNEAGNVFIAFLK